MKMLPVVGPTCPWPREDDLMRETAELNREWAEDVLKDHIVIFGEPRRAGERKER